MCITGSGSAYGNAGYNTYVEGPHFQVDGGSETNTHVNDYGSSSHSSQNANLYGTKLSTSHSSGVQGDYRGSRPKVYGWY